MDTDDLIDLVIYDLDAGKYYSDRIYIEAATSEEYHKQNERYLSNSSWPFIEDIIK